VRYFINIYFSFFVKAYIGCLKIVWFLDSLDAHPLQKVVDKNNKQKIRKLENKFVYYNIN
jgi:hypothetical protein